MTWKQIIRQDCKHGFILLYTMTLGCLLWLFDPLDWLLFGFVYLELLFSLETCFAIDQVLFLCSLLDLHSETFGQEVGCVFLQNFVQGIFQPFRETFIFLKAKLCTIKYGIPCGCVKEQNFRATKILSAKLLIECIFQY